MNATIQIIAIVGSVGVMLIVFEYIRRRKLREEYSFFWFFGSLILIGFSIWRDGLHVLAALVGVDYPPSVLLLGVIVLGFFVALHVSVSLSRLADQNKRLAQEVAILKQALDQTVSAQGGPTLASDQPPAGD